METTSRVTGASGPAALERSGAERAVDGFLMAAFPWYGLDEAFTGPRWLVQVGTAADGTVEHGSTGHGEKPSLKVEANPDNQRFAVVVTVASRPGRRSADGTGTLEATSVSTAAWLAGSGLLSCTWPQEMERGLRQDWLDQQTVVAWELADDLDGENWSTLSLPVDGVPTDFHYRESEYGWVLAGSAQGGVHIGAYGRGMSAYGLGFSVVKDITGYESAEPEAVAAPGGATTTAPEPTESVEPAESAKPSETESAESAKPSETEPAESAKPAESESAEPSEGRASSPPPASEADASGPTG